MSMRIDSSKIEPDIVVVHLSGNVTLMPENQINDPFINDLLERQEKKVIFDLTGVEHMDSSGVQLMVQCSAAVQKAGGQLRLAAANPRVARLFQITRLDSMLPLYPTISAASEAFTTGPK
ncbi:MAG: STAS domain-containing protein [Acidobacteriia bacterium]|nr:STAS domain-containing protein [Terriglobia bacterium]